MPRATVQRTLAECWAAYFVAASALSVLDAALAFSRSGVLHTSIHYLAISILLAAWVALLCAVVTMLCMTFGRLFAGAAADRPTWVLAVAAGIAGGALTGAIALLLLRPWDHALDPYHMLETVPAVCMASGAVVGWCWTRLRSATLVALLTTVAVVALVADAFVMRGLYRPLHNAAAFFALHFAALAALRLRVHLVTRNRFGAFVVLALAAQLTLLGDARAARLLAKDHGTLARKWLGLGRALADRDQDGHSSALWGGGL